MDAASGELRTLGTHAWRRITHVAWLPDGKALLVNGQEATREASSQIWLMSVPAGEVSGDGKSLIYTVSRGGATNLWRQSLAGGPAEQVTKFSDEAIFRYALSHDQKRWAIVRGNTSSDVVLVSERR